MYDIYQILTGFPGPAWIHNAQGLIEWNNDTLERYAGASQPLTGEPHIARFHPLDHHRLLMAALQSAQSGGWNALRARIANRRGVYGWFLINIGFFPRQEDNSARWITIALDTLDPRSAEKELADSEQRRQHAVMEVQSMQQFIGIASHELRTPVSVIKAYAQMLRSEISDFPETKYGPIVDQLADHADKLAKLVDFLLDTTQLNGQISHSIPRQFQMTNVVKDCLDTVAQINEFRPVKIFTDGDDWTTYADQERIRQVLLNLLTNAYKFSPAGTPIEIHLWKDATNLGFSIKNEGEGIPDDIKKKIFAPFTRGAKDQNGAGLGLYVCAQIINNHHGRIWAESDPGQGATFSFTLPIAPTNIPSTPKPSIGAI